MNVIDPPLNMGVELGFICLIGLTLFGVYVLWKTITTPLL